MAKLQVTLQVWGNNHSKMLSIQGEAGSRTVEVAFLDASGAPIDLTGCTPRMVVDNGVSDPPMNDGTIVDAPGGIADFTVTSDMLTHAGDWPCEFALTGPNYPPLKANGLTLHVEVSHTENAVGSTNQLASLWIALNKADTAAEQTEQAEKNSETAVKNANTAIATVTANESTRQTNEQTRQDNESTRKSDEDARKTAETGRASAESTRQLDESTRQSQEQTRKDAESARATTETTRGSNESIRKSNEAARQTAESTRASDEDARKTNETARQTAESARATAESARADAEAARKSAESARVTAESGRATAESARVTAESARATAENQRVTDSQTAVSNADAATSRANAAAQSVDDAIKGDIGPAVDSEISKKINVANGIAGLDSNGKLVQDANTLGGHSATSGQNPWGCVPVISHGDGVMEVGKYLDFHTAGNGTTDYDVRMTAGNNDIASSGSFTAPDGFHGKADNAATLNGHDTDNGSNSVLLSGRKAGTAIGLNSTAEGAYTTASGYDSHAEGDSTTASGYDSHAEGDSTTASGYDSHAEGATTQATGAQSHVEGLITTANTYCSHVQGQYNKGLSGDAGSFSATSDAMVIGNGTFDISTVTTNYSNCFRVTFDGKVYGLSSFNSSGADYSEFFEWFDENPNKEDRVGHFVTLDSEKIKYANDGDYIVGIVSGAPAIIGDHPSESWSKRWVKDVFGRIQTEDVDVPETQEKDKDGNVIHTVPAHIETRFKVNPDYDPTKEADYLNREKRLEWDTVGMLGKLVCIDDGTCVVNGYCKPKDGIATKADTGYRVIARLDATHIKVLFK